MKITIALGLASLLFVLLPHPALAQGPADDGPKGVHEPAAGEVMFLQEVQALCPRIAVMDAGVVKACDTLPNLLRRLDGIARLAAHIRTPGWHRRRGSLRRCWCGHAGSESRARRRTRRQTCDRIRRAAGVSRLLARGFGSGPEPGGRQACSPG